MRDPFALTNPFNLSLDQRMNESGRWSGLLGPMAFTSLTLGTLNPKARAGSYVVRLTEKRPGTQRDRELHSADMALSSAEALLATGAPENFLVDLTFRNRDQLLRSFVETCVFLGRLVRFCV